MKSTQRWHSLSDLVRYLAAEQEWMPLRKAAKLYRVTPETMQAWVKQGCFTSTYIENALWISRTELETGLSRFPEKPHIRDR